MVSALSLQDFVVRARVLKLYRQALRATKRAPPPAEGVILSLLDYLFAVSSLFIFIETSTPQFSSSCSQFSLPFPDRLGPGSIDYSSLFAELHRLLNVISNNNNCIGKHLVSLQWIFFPVWLTARILIHSDSTYAQCSSDA